LQLAERHNKICAYLRLSPFSRGIFNPFLSRAFEYVVKAQLEEFERQYGEPPQRIDGHHHMHLCANVMRGELLPQGTIVRRNFSFGRGEKSFVNRRFRAAVDRKLARRHLLADAFYSLPPLEPQRLRRIFALANQHSVEIETHPVRSEEYSFLMGEEIRRLLNSVIVARPSSLASFPKPHGPLDSAPVRVV
jgi:hypothetical protein